MVWVDYGYATLTLVTREHDSLGPDDLADWLRGEGFAA